MISVTHSIRQLIQTKNKTCLWINIFYKKLIILNAVVIIYINYLMNSLINVFSIGMIVDAVDVILVFFYNVLLFAVPGIFRHFTQKKLKMRHLIPLGQCPFESGFSIYV